MSDIVIAVETVPQLSDEELQEAFDSCGDEPFHNNVERAIIHGEADVEGAPGLIEITLDTRDGGRLAGMVTEADLFIRRALHERVTAITSFSVTEVPTDDEVRDALAGYFE